MVFFNRLMSISTLIFSEHHTLYRCFIPELISILKESVEWMVQWLTHKGSYLSPPTGITCRESHWKSPPLLIDCPLSGILKHTQMEWYKQWKVPVLLGYSQWISLLLTQCSSNQIQRLELTVMNGWIDRFKYLKCLKCYLKMYIFYSEIVFAQFSPWNYGVFGGFCCVSLLKPGSLVENSGK